MNTRHFSPVVLLVLSSTFLASCGASNSEILSDARTVEVTLMRHLPTGMVSWIKDRAADVAMARLDEENLRQLAREHVAGEDPDGEGTDALTFFVMMEAVRTVDRKSVEDRNQSEALTRAKTIIDALVGSVDSDLSNNSGKDDSDPCQCGSYAAPLENLAGALEQSKTWLTIMVREPTDVGDLKALKGDLEHMNATMGELSEMQQLRLQAAMERSAQFMNIISSLMKNVSDTNASIIQNLK